MCYGFVNQDEESLGEESSGNLVVKGALRSSAMLVSDAFVACCDSDYRLNQL